MTVFGCARVSVGRPVSGTRIDSSVLCYEISKAGHCTRFEQWVPAPSYSASARPVGFIDDEALLKAAKI
jgi:hypothetical protein